MNNTIARTVTLLVGVVAIQGVSALPVTITTPFMNLENDGINSDGFVTGEFLRIGANSVTPNGVAGTVGLGSTVDLATHQLVTTSIGFTPGPAIPNFFQRRMTDNPDLYGPWTLTFLNGADSSTAQVSLPVGAKQAPFVNTLTLSGTGQNPTFTWAPPPGTTVNGYRINIYDKSLINFDSSMGPINTGQVTGVNVLPNVTSYTVQASDFTLPGYSFQVGRNYSIEIGLIQTKDGTSNNLGNGNLQAISRVYADFTPTATGGPIVNLPVTLANRSFQFNMAVDVGKTYYIDPAVAVGYDYATAAGNPSFKSVVLPTGIGDGLYDICGFDANNQKTLLAHDWAGGAVFDFSGSGVSRFSVTGIELNAGLNPASTTAFVTGLTFESAGVFTGTQTPITVAVPEPASTLLMLIGLGCVGGLVRRRCG